MADQSNPRQRFGIVGRAVSCAMVLLVAGCAPKSPQVLGTVEWDRITLPAPVSERIAKVDVREGDAVAAGATVMTLETTRTQARLDAAKADVARLQTALDELRAGPRREDIAQARARLAGARSVATNARQALQRAQAEFAKQVIPRASLDAAIAQSGSAEADAQAAQQALAILLHGSRPEDIAQAQSAVASAQAQVDSITVDLQRVRIAAPRVGRIDSLPYRQGDQPPIGAPLAVELVGDAPYARVYVPEPLRAGVKIGAAARVTVDGRAGSFAGRVRAIRAEPSFTPYYALTGEDASRLSYLAEIQLGKDAADLPIGVPVHVEFAGGAGR
ncbi:MAG: HlyD family efflux transporter periplasmic adaptor subunit [Proteobacteria bacterium]|nr:HlyD family efflux transporter periplasmic adaptor subunit [Pseudomonadota bacterium]